MIPFNKPFLIENELNYIKDAINQGILRGDGIYTKKMPHIFGAKTWLQESIACPFLYCCFGNGSNIAWYQSGWWNNNAIIYFCNWMIKCWVIYLIKLLIFLKQRNIAKA